MLESQRDAPDAFSAYGRIVMLFIVVALFTICWWILPFITVVFVALEYRLDVWRMTVLLRRNIPRSILGEDFTNGWHAMLVSALPAMYTIVALFWCFNTSGLEGTVAMLNNATNHKAGPCVPLFDALNSEYHSHGGLAWLYPGCGWDDFDYANASGWKKTESKTMWNTYISGTKKRDGRKTLDGGHHLYYGMNRKCFSQGDLLFAGASGEFSPADSRGVRGWEAFHDACPFRNITKFQEENDQSPTQIALRLFCGLVLNFFIFSTAFWVLPMCTRGKDPRPVRQLSRAKKLDNLHQYAHLSTQSSLSKSKADWRGAGHCQWYSMYYQSTSWLNPSKSVTTKLNIAPLQSSSEIDDRMFTKMILKVYFEQWATNFLGRRCEKRQKASAERFDRKGWLISRDAAASIGANSCEPQIGHVAGEYSAGAPHRIKRRYTRSAKVEHSSDSGFGRVAEHHKFLLPSMHTPMAQQWATVPDPWKVDDVRKLKATSYGQPSDTAQPNKLQKRNVGTGTDTDRREPRP